MITKLPKCAVCVYYTNINIRRTLKTIELRCKCGFTRFRHVKKDQVTVPIDTSISMSLYHD